MIELIIALCTVLGLVTLGSLSLTAVILWRQYDQAKEMTDEIMSFASSALETVKAENAMDKAQADAIRASAKAQIGQMQDELRRVGRAPEKQGLSQVVNTDEPGGAYMVNVGGQKLKATLV